MLALRTSLLFLFVFFFILYAPPQQAQAVNIGQYSNTLSDSGPDQNSNHTFKFTPKVTIPPSSYIEVDFPVDFQVSIATTTFAQRNVELYINGVPRPVASSSGFGVDEVSIVRGNGGLIRYTLGSDVTIVPDDRLELRVGNNTSGSFGVITSFSTTTGTTTTPADIEPIRNSNTLGVHEIPLEIVNGSVIANTDFVVFLNKKVTIPVDTTETVPPVRFNGAPTSTVGGTTLSVEISLETNELAICKYSTDPDISFTLMPNTFSNTGFLQHSTVVGITPNSIQRFYVRCIDDEDNFNIDDYLIIFTVTDTPAGTSNTDGSVSGDGTGTGNDGTGTGSNAGGTSGIGGGEDNTEGTTSGSGGSGGGGGGGSGDDSGSSGGGGFESGEAPYASGDGRVIINGYAYPGSRVVVLVDGQLAQSTTAGRSGVYSVTIDEIARGAYTFGIYAQDETGDTSDTFSTSFTVTGSRASRLSNITLSPSITVEPDPAEAGELIEISGYALPDATISIETSRSDGSNPRPFTALSDADGRWRTTVDTTGYARDTYRVRVKAEQLDGITTDFSAFEFFGIGQSADRPLSPDLNRDGSVNLIDFSILLFWWQTNGGDSDPPADINQDGGVNLTDFSILLFNWTG